MPVLATNPRAKLAKALAERKPLWDGPYSGEKNGGITQSLLGRFLSCRERFRLLVVEGYKPPDKFNHRLGYGNFWHTCEEATAAGKHYAEPLKAYCQCLIEKYGNQSSGEINKWYQVCLQQYPVYLDHWKKHPDVKGRKAVFQEQIFRVPYRLPSGRTVYLNGKMDSVDVIPKDQYAPTGLYIQENKTKGEADEDQTAQDLPWDLQSGLYLTALSNMPLPKGIDGKYPIGGVRYNVVRRPISGGKYTIKQKVGLGKAKKGAETPEQFYARLGKVIASDTKHFFFRLKMEVSPADLARFQERCLNPILEQVCDWWDWIKVNPFDPWKASIGLTHHGRDHNNIHFQMPTGVYNPLMEGRSTEFDNYLLTGDNRGLHRVTTLFSELE